MRSGTKTGLLETRKPIAQRADAVRGRWMTSENPASPALPGRNLVVRPRCRERLAVGFLLMQRRC